MHSLLRLTAVIALVGGLAGCNTMRFEIADVPRGAEVHQRKAFFLWGLAPTRQIDVSQHCPDGAAAVMEETTFVDGLFRVITLGIYTPRSSTYYCRAGGTP